MAQRRVDKVSKFNERLKPGRWLDRHTRVDSFMKQKEKDQVEDACKALLPTGATITGVEISIGSKRENIWVGKEILPRETKIAFR